MYTEKHILNCYRKFKSYVYYSKNLSFLYPDIAEFEYDDGRFQARIREITDALNKEDYSFFEGCIGKMEIVPLIKSIDDYEKQDSICSNERPRATKTLVKKINFFIKLPIELYIIDTLWTLLGLAASSGDERFRFCYANVPAKGLIKNKNATLLERINFDSLSIFEQYYHNYIKWQESIIEEAKECKKTGDVTLISFDVRKYFYSANIQIHDVEEYLISRSGDFKNHSFLTILISGIYKVHKKMIDNFAPNLTSNNPLPIGLVSSCFIANYYLSEFDNQINDNDFIIRANRYVDDILILVKGNTKKSFSNLVETVFFDSLIKGANEGEFLIKNTDLVIQNDKTRIFNIYKKGDNKIINKLQKEVFPASNASLFPKYISNFDELYNRVSNDERSLKIRDNIIKTTVNPAKFASSLSGLSLGSKDCVSDDALNKEKLNSILGMLDSKALLSIFNRWNNFFYFFIKHQKNMFNSFSKLVSASINKIKFDSNMGITKLAEQKLRSNLNNLYCIAVAEAAAPSRHKILTKDMAVANEVNKLSLKIRKANLFDKDIVSYPLSNYLHDNKLDLRKWEIGNVEEEIDFNKLLLSPRFIHLDEYLYYKQLGDLYSGLLCNVDIGSYIRYYNSKILPLFGGKKEKISVLTQESQKKEYKLTEIVFPSIQTNFDLIPVALANVDLSKHNLTKKTGYDLELTFEKGTIKQKRDLLRLLEQSVFEYRKAKNSKEEDKIVPSLFLVFPEYYLPIEWLPILIKCSKKTGANIVTGLRPIKLAGNKVINVQAVIVPFVNAYWYKESMLILREKNNYAPLDKQVIKNSKCYCEDPAVSNYYVFNNGKISFSSLICYELTDVNARSMLKNHAHIVISSEYNEDIYYFSNIVESSARDLGSFIVQVNTSNYGDSRIVAPYRDKYKEIVNITGGTRDSTHIGIINLKEYISYLDDYFACDKECNYKSISPTYTHETEKYKKYKKPSAKIRKI